MSCKPYVRVQKKNANGHRAGFFAIKLRSCIAARDAQQQPTQFLERWLGQQADLIRALYVLHGRPAFAVRTIIRPHSTAYSAGTVDVAFLGRIEGQGRDETVNSARELGGNCTAVLSGSLPNHLWSMVGNETQFNALWQPFDLETAQFAEIRRHEDVWSLAKPHARIRLGKQAPEAELTSGNSSRVYCVAPVTPHPNSLARLFRILLLREEPTVLQALLVPTQLTEPERAALADEIGTCERLIRPDYQVGAGLSSPAIHDFLARQLRQVLNNSMMKLQAGAFQMAFQIASPGGIPQSLAQAIGAELVDLLPRRDSDCPPMTTGSFDIVAPQNEQEEAACRTSFGNLEAVSWGDSKAPETLKRLRHLLDATEAGAFFRFPLAATEGLQGIPVRHARVQPLPRELAAGGANGPVLVLGENTYLGTGQRVMLSAPDRSQHLYMVGQTGTGKTTLLEAMILADIHAGHGVAVVDPHGDLFNKLKGLIPPSRAEDVVLFDAMDVDFPVGLNLLECQTTEDRYFVVRELQGIMERLLADQYQEGAAQSTGPIFYQHMQMNLLLAMSNPDDPGTLLDFYDIYTTPKYYKRWLPLKCDDPQLARWVDGPLARTDYQRRGSDGSCSMGEYLSSKFVDFIFDPKLRLIFGQKRSTIQIREIMDQGKILLVNLAKGPLSEANSRFLGMILMAKIQSAAMSRLELPVEKRRPFYLYIDEFQSLATENFVAMMSEGRKFGLSMVLANQFISQIKNERIMKSVFGNAGTLVAMRVGTEDAKLLEPYFSPTFDAADLSNLPNWEACVKTRYRGQVLAPFSLCTLAPDNAFRAEVAEEVRKRSRQKYGRPKQNVLKEIEEARVAGFQLESDVTDNV